MTRLRRSALLLFIIFLLPALAAFGDDINKISPTGYVTDLAGVIPQPGRQRLEALCTELEQKTGAQMAIVTVRSLDDRPIEDYAVDLYKHLGVGAKKDDTGVLLLLAPNNRKYRVEVGYGLEPIINDARAGDAGRAMVPFLRQNNYGAAIEMAAWQLAKYVADRHGVTLSGNPPARPLTSTNHGSPISVFAFFILLVFVLRIFSFIISRGAGLRGGGFSGCWWILPFLMSGGGGRGGGSSWGGGGFGGSGGGGGGFGGFGGGSSGGGGASGSW